MLGYIFGSYQTQLYDQTGINENPIALNICNQNYTNSILNGHERAIIGFDVHEKLAATISFDNSLKLWDMQNGICLKTVKPDPKINWRSLIKIIDGKIVCTGSVKYFESGNTNLYATTISIFDLNTLDKTAEIFNTEFDPEAICMVGNRIFCHLKNGNISEYDLKGFCVQRINSKNIQSEEKSKLVGYENLLIKLADNEIVVHDMTLKTNHCFQILNHGVQLKASSACINNSNLVFETYIENQNQSLISFIDIEKSLAQKKLCANKVIIVSGKVTKFVLDGKWLYSGNSSGELVATKLNTNEIKLIGKHPQPIYHLAVDGEVLISGSEPRTINTTAEVKFWNKKSSSMLAHVQYPSLFKIQASDGNLYAAVGKSFVHRNYQVLHQGVLNKNDAKILPDSVYSEDYDVFI